MLLDLVCGSASLAEKARDINHNSDQGYLETKGAARGGAEGAQAPPLAIRILMFIS